MPSDGKPDPDARRGGFPTVPPVPEFPEIPESGHARASRPESGQKGIQAYLRYSFLGLYFLAVFALCLGAGYGLDEWLGTLPWLTVLGAFIGTAIGTWLLYKELIRPGGPQ